jgi:hypothetical protein
VRSADLLEAEGRALREVARTEGKSLRKHLANLSLGAAVLVVAAPLAVAGLSLLLASIYLALRGADMSPAGATAITGAVTLLAAGLLIWLFKTLTK